ncbi:MAG: alpha/beta fold hydrolase [Parvibaculum sp.]|nr:alpha/beta fold hydrolase [Parvibaculum sp.]
MPFAKAGGIDIFYERVGSGPRLLFISGTGGDLRLRPNVLDGPFPKHFDMLAYDQRGLGQTSKPDEPYSMAQYAEDAVNLMAAIGWGSALVAGVSFGGMVAQELAINHPHVVEGLVLACTSPGGAGGASWPLHKLMDMGNEERARFMIPISDTRHDEAWAKANPETYEQIVAMAAADPYAGEEGHDMGRRRQLEARALHNTWSRLDQIRCPTLICGGKYDGIALPETQELMASRIRGAQLRFFEGGHLFMLQDRTALPAMISFLKGEDAG